MPEAEGITLSQQKADLKRRRLLRVLVAGAVCVIAGIIALGIWASWESRQLIWAHAIRSGENIATTLEHDIRRNIESYDLSLQAVVEGLGQDEIGTLSAKLQNLVLFDRAATAQYLGSILVLDRDGNLVIDSASLVPRRGNFADREYFQAHVQTRNLGLFVTRPFFSRLDQQWEIAFSRRLENRDGSFRGAVVGTMQLAFFRQLFQGVDLGPNASISLVTDQATLIAHQPFDEMLIGRDLRDAELFRRYPQQRSGWFSFAANRDGIERLFVFQQIGDLPLVLSIGTASDTIFAEWRQKTIVIGIAVVGLTLVTLLFGWFCFAELRRRARAEAAARESERNYRLLADHSLDMIVRATMDGVREYVSPAARRIFGYEPDQLVGTRSSDFIHPEDRDHALSLRRRLESDAHEVTTSYRVLRSDGEYIWVESSRRVYEDPVDGQVKILGVVRDISERKQFEIELENAKRQAEEANEAKSRFLADMSHELRTPLNAVIGFSDLIQRATLGPLGNPGYQEYADEIRRGGEHLLELINEVLDHAKASSGRLELQDEIVSVAAVIDFAIRMLKPRAEQGGIVLHANVSPEVPPIRGDEKRLRQVLLNLMTNAIKFTPPGGEVSVTASLASGGELIIAVKDTGVGIPEAEQDKVFEAYALSDNALTRRTSGTGLGLPLSKRLVELHDGSLTLRSSVGVGTTLTIILPRDRMVTDLRRASTGAAE